MPEAYRLPHPNVDDAILFAVVLEFFIARQARMKEVKVAKERQQQLILEAAERLMRYQELLDTYTKGGDEMTKKDFLIFALIIIIILLILLLFK